MKQGTLSSFFGGGNKSLPEPPPEKVAKTSTSSSTRTLSVKTAENWKTTSLAKYNASDRLILNVSNGLVTSMKCTTCSEFEDKIASMKGFMDQWSRDGSKQQQHSAAVQHANTDTHARSNDLHVKSKGLKLIECSQKKGLDQQTILSGLATMTERDTSLTKMKFETAYFIAKEELPLKLYPKLFKHKEKKDLETGQAYCNKNSCGVFTDYISKDLKLKLQSKLNEVNFVSVLCDGSNDSAISENEAVFVLYLDPSPPESEEVQIRMSLIKLVFLKSADAPDLVDAIEDAFKTIDMDVYEKLVSFDANGTNTNSGHKDSVKAILQHMNPWLTFGWCILHRLELALKDGLGKNQLFQDVEEMILRLYYIYKKSPKK